MVEEVCQCGFGEEYFTIEDGQNICTICGGHVAVQEPQAPPEPRGRRGKRVLIVDDQPFFRQRIRDALGGAGHDVVEASEGIEAVRLLAAAMTAAVGDPSRGVDVVVLDLTMPGLIDGFQTLGVIKALQESLPVVVLTSSPPTQELLQKLGQLKARKYLNKASRDLEGLLLRNLEGL